MGGISNNGRAKRIKLIRKTQEKQEVYLIDLSTIDGLKDASLTLQSNDIIYVEPIRNYAREILSDVTPVLGLISTATSLWATYLIIANQP